ncbi:uncharacterized protein A4U43_C04F7160 [Asparagus officinalis]|uniref:CASP-like protein n=1 Tax=Asparagus officinalis TaxID=4686 RepID=A0A5P1F3V2_ASPOF|nr:casparian strip membrane protein 3-like [Asparagus officinalis]ONK71311.1 uncharacterized protein A4U43_C04F7160 [Asparagus officinalis]
MISGDSASTAIIVRDPNIDSKGKAPIEPASPPAAAPKVQLAAISGKNNVRGCRRCIALLDFLLRLCAIGASLAATITMGTTEETLPFSGEFFQYHASYEDLPALTFFVIGNAVTAGYLVLSLPFSLVTVIWPQVLGLKLLLLVLDTVMLALVTSSAASAASIVYLAHNGDPKANWVSICMQFHGFCQRINGAVVASFVASVVLIVLVVMSGLVLRKH